MAEKQEVRPMCGIVMPISEIDGCSESHWADVLSILSEAIEEADFEPNLVSNADDVGIIHKRIIQNLYENPIVVCDVSGKNPNVMFELGMRLAFDKPTIIVKDEKTSYSFDTAAIEHLEYPRDLRFSRIVEFKQKLAEKISATNKKASADPGYTTFLKHFGEFTVAKIEKKEVSGQEFILEELKYIRNYIHKLDRPRAAPLRYRSSLENSEAVETIDICLKRYDNDDIKLIMDKSLQHLFIKNLELRNRGDHQHLLLEIKSDPTVSAADIRRDILPRIKLKSLRSSKAIQEDLHKD